MHKKSWSMVSLEPRSDEARILPCEYGSSVLAGPGNSMNLFQVDFFFQTVLLGSDQLEIDCVQSDQIVF